MLLNEIKEHLKQNKAPYILGVLVSLLTPLFLVIWQRWLYGLLAQRGQAVPRQVLGAVIGVLLIILLALFALVILYAREVSALKKSRPRPKEIVLEPNDVLILKAIAACERRYEEPIVIARTTGLDLTVTEFHCGRLNEAAYLEYSQQGFYYLTQKAREYLIDNKIVQ